MSNSEGCFPAAAIMALFLAAIVIGFFVGRSFTRFQAVESGAAHWEVDDPAKGNPVFRWHSATHPEPRHE